jgi:hypothetical protein
MLLLIILGGLMVAAGLFGLGYCVRSGLRIRREKPEKDVIQARLQQLVAINLGSVGVAALGLGLIVVGLILGR